MGAARAPISSTSEFQAPQASHRPSFFGGFWVDALAGIDIALWDLFGKLARQPVVKLLGGQRQARIPAYISGLPRATLQERVELIDIDLGRAEAAQEREHVCLH